MKLEDAKRLIKKYTAGHSRFVIDADVAERYYKNENDILYLEKQDKPKKQEKQEQEAETPLRKADNRISHNFHGLLVNQKASYMFTYPPLFDVGTTEGNQKITDILGGIIDLENEGVASYSHNMGRVPFIPFFNNEYNQNDLKNVKPLIDTYDRVYSGFFNDLEDIQEIIFILSGYGGTNLGEFLKDLKLYKTVKLDEEEGNPGLSTLTIDIPVEAREKMLTITRKEIFELGQGVDPQPENYGNASGEALKFMYSLLELKSGLMETEFRIGFGTFIRAICEYAGIGCEKVEQTWTRNRIRSDSELSGICAQSSGIISQETIVKNHPFVTDYEKELERLEEEKEKEQEDAEWKYQPFNVQMDAGNKDGEKQDGEVKDET